MEACPNFGLLGYALAALAQDLFQSDTFIAIEFRQVYFWREHLVAVS